MPSQLYEAIKRTTIEHMKAYESPNPFDAEAVQRYRTPDFVHLLHPAESLPAGFDVPLHSAEFTQALDLFAPVIDRLSMEVRDMLIDEEKRMVAVQLKGDYDFKAFGDEPAEKNYTVEYMWLAEMTDQGDKIARIEEFMDVQRLMDHVKPKAERYLAFVQSQAK